MSQPSSWPLFRAALLLLPAGCLIALTWFLALDARLAPAGSPGLAAQLRRQQALLDHRLNEMVRAWQQDPRGFAVKPWSRMLGAADGTLPDIILVNAQGVVVQSTAPGPIGADLHDEKWFRIAQQRAAQGDTAAITTVQVDDALQDWHIGVARWLAGPDRRFTGVLVANAGVDRLNALFRPVGQAGATQPLIGRQRLLLLLASAVTVLLVALVVLFVRGERSRRRDAALVPEHRLLAAANEALLAAESRAEALAAQLGATISGVSDGMALLDAQLRLLEWNQSFAELASVPERLLQPGTSMEEILRAQAEAGQFGRVPVEPEVARRLSVLRNLTAGQVAERTGADGRVIALRRIPLPNGTSVALYRDITGRRQADTVLREAQAQADSAIAAKTRFVSIISSEIRVPLNALLHSLQLLDSGNLPPARRALLHSALASGETLLGLVNDILEMSSMEAGETALYPGMFSLSPLLQEVVDLFASQAAERGITLGLATDPTMPAELYADRGRLRQVLVNLLSHVVRFGIPGPVALLARQDTDAFGRTMLSIAVRDRGPVIEEAGRERLFRPFSGLNLSGGESLGTSLGLAICRYLVTLMGGGIGCATWVAEDRHVGNEFWLRLPLAPVPSVQPSRPLEAEPLRPQFPRTRVLLVDANMPAQLLAALPLRREGHMVDVADSGEAALRMILRQPYDVVFTDIHMPGVNGVELARRIRLLPGAAATVPLIALSANIGPDDRLACEAAGIREVLDKPAALTDLAASMSRHVWPGLPLRGPVPLSAGAVPASRLLTEERIGELRARLPSDALQEMLQETLIELQARLPSLRSAVLAGDSDAAASHAHAMMGVAAGFGMAALEARLRALMIAMRGPHASAVAGLLGQLETDLARSAQALREALLIELV